jgi:type II secretory pathway component PulF
MFGISARRLIQFCQRVATSTRAGVDSRRLWTSEAGYGSATHRRHVEHIRNVVVGGGTVAEAMRDSGGYFPPLVVQMVAIGEQTGKLDEVLFRLAEYYEQQRSLRRMLMFGMAWPAIQLGLAVIIIGVLIWALGVVAEMRGGEAADVLGIGLVGTRGALIYFATVGTAIAVFVGLCIALARGAFGPTPVLLAMRLPVIGGAFEAFALSRLTWTLSTALESGMDARRSVELAIDATQNPYYMSHRDRVALGIARGNEFHQSFAETNAFPADFIHSLHTAEIAGATSEALNRLTQEYEDKARTRLRLLAGLMTGLMFVLMFVVLIALIFRLAMALYIGPMYDALEQLNG